MLLCPKEYLSREARLERLRQIRERAGYSQQELADTAGVSQHTISEIELGRRKPQGRTLRKLASVLGVEVADFFPKAPPRLPELGPPGEAYFVPLEEDEEPDTVTLRLYTVRLMDERDRLLQEVRRLEREKAAMRQELEKSGRTRE